VPLVLGGLAVAVVAAAAQTAGEAVRVQLLGLRRGDDADLVVFAVVFAAGVADGVDVQLGGRGFA
jgi:hypothetical protein